MQRSSTYDEATSMQHQSHAQQIANFTFSAMLGVIILMVVGLITSDTPVVFEGGVPQVDFLVIPTHIMGVLAIVSSVSRFFLMKQGIKEHWGQNQVQFLLSTVIGVYILLAWFIF